MTVEEIRASGLLESYVLGGLSREQQNALEQHLIDFPELKTDLRSIERAFRAFAELNGMQPRPQLKAQIMKSIGRSDSTNDGPPPSTKRGLGPFFLPAILMMVLLGISWFWGNKQSKKASSVTAEYAEFQVVCDSIAGRNKSLQEIITHISTDGNKKLDLAPTDAYVGTHLFLFLNEQAGTNYLQASALPSLSANEVFQLWSLKDGQAPIPLTTFKGLENQIFKVAFEENTGTYAITIEKDGGSDKPDLSRLIGTIQV